MREKNDLDENILISSVISNSNKISYSELREKKKIREKVLNFNKNVVHCNYFYMKQEELQLKIYWCKKINKSCTYRNCPKINKSL